MCAHVGKSKKALLASSAVAQPNPRESLGPPPAQTQADTTLTPA